MPTENERKYVLQLESEEAFVLLSSNVYLLRQGYLAFAKGMSLRVRSAEPLNHSGPIKRRLCYKQKVDGRVIEIEKKVDERDFNELWAVSLSRLVKERHVVNFNGAMWEIDFFKAHNHATYFALAELEMPEGQLAPDVIPEIIERHLVYAAPPDEDDEFSSKRLACVRHAKRLYKELLLEHGIEVYQEAG